MQIIVLLNRYDTHVGTYICLRKYLYMIIRIVYVFLDMSIHLSLSGCNSINSFFVSNCNIS